VLPSPAPVETGVRSLSAAELLGGQGSGDVRDVRAPTMRVDESRRQEERVGPDAAESGPAAGEGSAEVSGAAVGQ
jgi:hypothetical protein